MIGTKFGNYKIEQKLGEGGMGIVYLAVDTDLDRKVALKTLATGGSQDDELVSRFLREAKAASRLQHPSIVTLYHFGLEGSTRYMVMEYVEGKTLRKVISGNPLKVGQMVDYAIQMTDGLAMAHENGVIHRDLKAENMMVTPRGHVKILDFGLAKLKSTKPVTGDDETAFRTQFGMVVGTVTTMSPEQAMGREVDASSDIFSLGVIFYQKTTGKLPFEGPTPQATMALILNQEPTPVSQVNPDIPAELDRLIQHCLQKNSVYRPSAREVLTRLKNIQATLSGSKLIAPEARTPSGHAMPAMSQTATVATAPPVPASSPQLKMPSGVRLQPTAADMKSRKAVFVSLKSVRIVLSLATLTVPLAYLLYFIISAGLIRTQAVEGTVVMRFIQAVVVPPLAAADRVFAFRMVVEGWNFLLLGLGVLAFIVRYVFMLPFTSAEHWAKTRLLKVQATAPQAAFMAVGEEAAAAPRLALLREYAEAKKVLFEDKKRLAFYSVDVVGSTKMKAGQDQLVVEHAFAEFKKYVERILELNDCWKSSWTPDGAMCAFRDVHAALKAAQEVLRGLAWFNEGVHALTKFRVRSGLHCGDVVFPEDKNIVEVSDFAIDVAGHLQKYCAEDALWASRELLEEVGSTEGFTLVDREVDGHKVFLWRADEKVKAAANE